MGGLVIIDIFSQVKRLEIKLVEASVSDRFQCCQSVKRYEQTLKELVG